MNKYEYGLDILKEEVLSAHNAKSVEKDILLVVYDQLGYVKQCIESLRENTENYNLYIWDNGSGPETKSYLAEIGAHYLHRNEENEGFIVPCNRLAEQTTAPYLILLNSDTKVYLGWDTAMTGWLETHPEVAQVGYIGGYLDQNGKGVNFGFGPNVDYISGFCFCIPRKTYEQFGLFDEEHLRFAYYEDSDFSMRLREAGKEIYALNMQLVWHYQNKTVKSVLRQRDLSEELAFNSAYIKTRWRHFLPD